MTETFWLIIFTAVSMLLLYLGRRLYDQHHVQPLTSRQESVARFGLMGISALVGHMIYSQSFDSLRFWIAVETNALVLYALSHIATRWTQKATSK